MTREKMRKTTVLLPPTLRRRLSRAGELWAHMHGEPMAASALIRQGAIRECLRIENEWRAFARPDLHEGLGDVDAKGGES